MIKLKRRGLMLVLSSPSGAGKTTLSRMLLENDNMIDMSISVTTRPKRPGEQEGVDYIFVDQKTFQNMVDKDAFLEHAQVFSNRYGTLKEPVETTLKAGKDVLFDVDWQGAQQIQQYAHNDLVKVFVLPPSLAVLEKRLRTRAQDSEAIVQSRMAEAASEITHWSEYDYVIINDTLEKSFDQLSTILAAERQKRHRQTNITDFVTNLTSYV